VTVDLCPGYQQKSRIQKSWLAANLGMLILSLYGLIIAAWLFHQFAKIFHFYLWLAVLFRIF